MEKRCQVVRDHAAVCLPLLTGSTDTDQGVSLLNNTDEQAAESKQIEHSHVVAAYHSLSQATAVLRREVNTIHMLKTTTLPSVSMTTTTHPKTISLLEKTETKGSSITTQEEKNLHDFIAIDAEISSALEKDAQLISQWKQDCLSEDIPVLPESETEFKPSLRIIGNSRNGSRTTSPLPIKVTRSSKTKAGFVATKVKKAKPSKSKFGRLMNRLHLAPSAQSTQTPKGGKNNAIKNQQELEQRRAQLHLLTSNTEVRYCQSRTKELLLQCELLAVCQNSTSRLSQIVKTTNGMIGKPLRRRDVDSDNEEDADMEISPRGLANKKRRKHFPLATPRTAVRSSKPSPSSSELSSVSPATDQSSPSTNSNSPGPDAGGRFFRAYDKHRKSDRLSGSGLRQQIAQDKNQLALCIAKMSAILNTAATVDLRHDDPIYGLTRELLSNAQRHALLYELMHEVCNTLGGMFTSPPSFLDVEEVKNLTPNKLVHLSRPGSSHKNQPLHMSVQASKKELSLPSSNNGTPNKFLYNISSVVTDSYGTAFPQNTALKISPDKLMVSLSNAGSRRCTPNKFGLQSSAWEVRSQIIEAELPKIVLLVAQYKKAMELARPLNRDAVVTAGHVPVIQITRLKHVLVRPLSPPLFHHDHPMNCCLFFVSHVLLWYAHALAKRL